jgi:NADH-quinone oxidoreductase subunit N
LATVSKGAVFVALSRFYLEAELYQYDTLIAALSVVAVASMLAGNWLALRQNNIKRLLAYSSIAHFGYLLVALIAMSMVQSIAQAQLIADAVTFYLTAYILTTLAAFAVVAQLSAEDDSKSMIDSFDGLFWRHPVQAMGLTVALLSFAGIPLTAGFIGKFYLINVAIESQLWALLIALILGSAIGIYYYLRFIFAMSKTSLTTVKPQSEENMSAQNVLATVLLILVLVLGSWPQPFIEFAGRL